MIELYKDFLDREDVSAREKLLLIMMLRIKHEGLLPTQQSLAKKLEMTHRTISKIIRELESRKIVGREISYARYGFGETIYKILIPISPSLKEHIPVDVKPKYPVEEVMEYLCSATGKSFILTDEIRGLITTRFEEGHVLDEFKSTIDKGHQAWSGTKYENFVNPLHLFDDNFGRRK